MIREAAKKHYIGLNKEFRYRGEEPGRLENFSDACFAIAIALLLISTSAPATVAQLRHFVYDLLPFSLCLVLFVLIWDQHFIFFFRYGLRDAKVIVLNTAFLIIVLFYAYPLKFLTRLVLIPVAYFTDDRAMLNTLLGAMESNADWGDLMIIYGTGGASIFFILFLMYRYALKKSAELELTEIEVLDTKISARTNLLMASVPVLSVVVAICFHGRWEAGMLGGFTYMLYTPIMMIHGKKADRQRKELLSKIEARDRPLARPDDGK